MQKSDLQYVHLHDICINAVQTVADNFGWGLGYGKLRSEDMTLLSSGSYGDLPWTWAFEQYGNPLGADTFDLSMRIKETDEDALGGAALCRIDKRRSRIEICMVENFLKSHVTPLSKRVWLSTLLFADSVATGTKCEDIYVMNPKKRYIHMYRQFGFYEDALCMPNLCATVEEAREALKSALRTL